MKTNVLKALAEKRIAIASAKIQVKSLRVQIKFLEREKEEIEIAICESLPQALWSCDACGSDEEPEHAGEHNQQCAHCGSRNVHQVARPAI